MKYAVLTIMVILFNGCITKTVYVDRPVEIKVPVKCKAPKVEEAQFTNNHAVTLLDILRERDELREAVKVCE